MRYFGGKSRIAKQIANYLSQYEVNGYWEPFCGGCSVLIELKKLKPNLRYYASDANEALITMWKALQCGYEFPSELIEEDYVTLRYGKDPKNPLTAFAGVGCSYGGKWFDGYARSGNRNYALNMKNSLEKVREVVKDVMFNFTPYFYSRINNFLIYCDPPYYKKRKGFSTNMFNHKDFWEWVRLMSQNNIVIVSEYTAPDDFECILEIETRVDMHTSETKKKRIEKLWKYKGGKYGTDV